jgi:signal transduction histidine kinase
MTADKLLYLASLVVFTFGTLTFSVLAISYWTERLRRPAEPKPRKPTVFPFFTLACAAAFLINLLFQAPVLQRLEAEWVLWLVVARHLAAGLLPPLVLHLIFEINAPGDRSWRYTLAAVYAMAILLSAAQGLDETGLFLLPAGAWLRKAPAIMLCATGILGIAIEISSRRRVPAAGRAHHYWIRALLLMMLSSAAVSLAQPGAFVGLLPDYLLLAFLCVSLYYRERLVFFDLLVKRGAFFFVGLVMLTAWFAVGGRFLIRTDWNPSILALLLLPFWLVGPWIYALVERGVDRGCLRRRYSTADAERRFLQAVQVSAAEDDLRERAAASLRDIFQAPAEVDFATARSSPAAGSGSLSAELSNGASPLGSIVLSPRANGIPFLSDDRRCLGSIASALGVVLENVRFRQDRLRQLEREQELRWLASRAELKALRAQINPHFLFNALNAIAGLIQEQPQLADDTIERLGRVFRYTLRKSEKEWVPLREEIEFVAAYLQVEQARFGERLQLWFDVSPAAALIPIPAMSIQPLVENAVKHGVSAVEGPGRVGLRASLDGQLLVVEVGDNGPGFPPGFSLDASANGEASHGLRNVVERLRGYYGNSARLAWDSGPEGTRVRLSVPLAPVAGEVRDTGSDRRR